MRANLELAEYLVGREERLGLVNVQRAVIYRP